MTIKFVPNDIVQYWIESWNNLCEAFRDIRYEFLLINPHILINEIIDEIKSNQMQNKDNKTYLTNQLKSHASKDNVIKNNYSHEFSILVDNIDSQNLDYVMNICKIMLGYFEKGDYRLAIFNRLRELLFSEKELEKIDEEIKYLTQSLIVELFLKGYSVQTILNIPRHLFSEYKQINKNAIVTQFPHNLDRSDFKNSKLYVKRLKEKLDTLTIEDRVNHLSTYLSKEKQKLFLIFAIDGVIGADYAVGDVTIYDPNHKKIINDKSLFAKDAEFFYREFGQIMNNAVVEVEAVDYKTAAEIAVKKIVKVFNILKLFSNQEASMIVRSESFLVVDKNKKLLQTAHGTNHNDKVYGSIYALDLNEKNALKKILESTKDWWTKENENLTLLEQNIIYSAHWFRKAIESKIDEDKLLNFWIVIESLMNFKENNQLLFLEGNQKETPYTLAKEIISTLEVLRSKNNPIIELFFEVGSHLQYIDLYDSYPINPLPDEKLEQLGLSIQNRSFYSFIENMDALDEYIVSPYFRKKVNKVKEFYRNNKKAVSILKEKYEYVQDDIQHIYRLRNKIVHNAHYDNKLLSYYAKKAEYYSKILLIQIIEEYQNGDSQVDLKSMYVGWHFKKSIFFKKLNGNKIKDLFKYKF